MLAELDSVEPLRGQYLLSEEAPKGLPGAIQKATDTEHELAQAVAAANEAQAALEDARRNACEAERAFKSFGAIWTEAEQLAAPALTADGWFERLTGYVTEQKAASVLEAAGHHVTFAATSNQPVWDLLVDGHAVQIEEGISGVTYFLGEHHGIPVSTSYEAAAAVKDPLVHGLAG